MSLRYPTIANKSSAPAGPDNAHHHRREHERRIQARNLAILEFVIKLEVERSGHRPIKAASVDSGTNVMKGRTIPASRAACLAAS